MTAPRRDAFATERAMAAIGRAALVGAVLIAVLDIGPVLVPFLWR